MRNPFRRRSNQTIAELESYYASQGSRRSAATWLTALISLLITVLVVALLFFGVRWVYRTVTDDNSDSTVETGAIDGQVDGSSNTVIINGPEDPRSEDDTTIGVLNPSDDEEGVVSDEAASTSRDVAGDSASSASGDDLPDTGAGEVLIAIPILTIALGYLISRKRQLR